jgi:hypothetical protein
LQCGVEICKAPRNFRMLFKFLQCRQSALHG